MPSFAPTVILSNGLRRSIQQSFGFNTTATATAISLCVLYEKGDEGSVELSREWSHDGLSWYTECELRVPKRPKKTYKRGPRFKLRTISTVVDVGGSYLLMVPLIDRLFRISYRARGGTKAGFGHLHISASDNAEW